MSSITIPTLAEFLAASDEEVAKIAPVTMIYGAGGTRRQAVFEGIEPLSDEYMRWARKRTISAVELSFRHGIHNLFTAALRPGNLQEVNRYQDHIIEKTKWVLAGDEAIADYRRLGWRVRLLGVDSTSTFYETAQYLQEVTAKHSQHTLYWGVVVKTEDPWRQIFTAVQQTGATTQAEAIRALYGEDIAPATLSLIFGKPMVALDIIPPLLIGNLQCYWNQQPGYRLTQTLLRTVLYDYAYLRRTWRAEKLERAREALAHRQAWEDGPTLGLGMRLGPFWYPAPMSSSAWSSE